MQTENPGQDLALSQPALLRLATVTLAVLAEKGLLTNEEAGAIVREAIGFLPPPELVGRAGEELRSAMTEVSKSLEAGKRG